MPAILRPARRQVNTKPPPPAWEKISQQVASVEEWEELQAAAEEDGLTTAEAVLRQDEAREAAEKERILGEQAAAQVS